MSRTRIGFPVQTAESRLVDGVWYCSLNGCFAKPYRQGWCGIHFMDLWTAGMTVRPPRQEGCMVCGLSIYGTRRLSFCSPSCGTLFQRYRITPEQYKRLISVTCCDICGLAGTYRGRGRGSLHVDHDHGNGQIRGFLDPACNQILGLAGEDTSLISLLATYLETGHGRVPASIPSIPYVPGRCIVCLNQCDLDQRQVGRAARPSVKWNRYCRQKCRLYAGNLRLTYGLEPGQYRFLLDEQSGDCRACGRPMELDSRQTVVDHNHATKQIRGILHNNCNVIIGFAEDSINRLESIIGYLASPRPDAPTATPNKRTQRPARSNVPSTLVDASWDIRFIELQTHIERFGKYPTSVDPDPSVRRLAAWMWGLRDRYNTGRLQATQASMVESLAGWTWDPRAHRWEAYFAETVKTFRREGRMPVRKVHTEASQFEWLTRQRNQNRQGILDPTRKRRLDTSLPGWGVINPNLATGDRLG